MNAYARIARSVEWKAALIAAVTAPLVVLCHELAHVLLLEAGGIDAQLRGFSMAVPVGYSWDFHGLEQAASFYDVNGRSIAFAALAGPLTTLLIACGALLARHHKQARMVSGGALSALVLRMVGITEFMPRFLDGSMNRSDEAIVAHFLDLPLLSIYMLSLVLGYLCMFLLYRAVEQGERSLYSLSTIIGGIVGYFAIDILANALIFRPGVWGR